MTCLLPPIYPAHTNTRQARTETFEGEAVGSEVTNAIIAFSAAITSLVSLGGFWLNVRRMSASERSQAASNAAHRMAEGGHVENNAVEWAHGTTHHTEPGHQPEMPHQPEIAHQPDTGTTDGAKP